VEAGERGEIEEHLERCPECREALERERALADGVRVFAREQLKSRLEVTLRSGKSRLPWPHILSAAAMILVVVGLGYYNAWWKDTPPSVNEVDITVETSPGEDRPALPPSVPTESPRQADEIAAGEVMREAEEAGEAEESRVAPAGAGAEGPARMDARAGLDDKMRAEAPSTALAFEPGPIWIQGAVLEAEGTLGVTKKEKVVGINQKAAAAEEASTRSGETTQLVSISQKPLNRIPERQAGLQRSGSILASAEMRNEVLELTLYSDTLSHEGQDIRVVPVTGDSLVVSINGMQVAYRIPEAWGKGKNVQVIRK
jgi:hypothetical protein